MEYKPWIGALNVHVQGFIFCVMEVIYQLTKKYQYDREILELSDGGEIALDWLIHPNKEKYFDSERHIIILIPGVNGDSSKLYAFSLHETCIKNGFDLVVINWRGMGGVPLKVSKRLCLLNKFS